MKFNEDDTIEITIQGTGPQTYLHHGDETTVTADITSATNGDEVAAFLELHDDLGGLSEGRIDLDKIPVEYEDGTQDEKSALTMFDSEEGEGPHWAGAIVEVEEV